jgi:hypothetical protein
MPKVTVTDSDAAPSRVVNEDSQSPVKIQMSDWRGELRIDIRHHFTPRNAPHKLLPTKKGASIPVEYLDDVIETLLTFKEMLDAEN